MCESRTAGSLGSAEMNEKGMGLTVYITVKRDMDLLEGGSKVHSQSLF